MTTNLIPTGKGKISALYQRMQIAIADCYSVDDCKQIAVQASAIAAYFTQIKDDSSVKKFLQIKLRAWRRIGEILVGSGVDKSTCETTADYIRKIRAAFKHRKEIEDLSDGAFRQALKITEVSKDFFDQNVGKHANIESLVSAFLLLQRREWEASPAGQIELKKEQQRIKLVNQQLRQEELQRQKEAQQQQQEAAAIKDLMMEREKAFDEVGITLDRRDREQMSQIVFLLKKSIHEILRQAAFDHRVTMQSILRSGLMMWFIAHGYNVPVDDMKLHQRETRQKGAKQHGH